MGCKRGERSPLCARAPPGSGNRRRRRRRRSVENKNSAASPHPLSHLSFLQSPNNNHNTGHHHPPADAVTYAGVSLRRRSALQYGVSKAVGAATWFWVFFMLYNEWDHKVKGLPAMFEAEGMDDDDDEGGGHGHH